MDVVADRVPSDLVSRPAWERARSVAEWLPASLAQAFYLECRLGANAEQVDWIVRVERTGGDIIAGRNPKLELPEPLKADEAWIRLACLCAAWADDRLLRRVVAHLWLEFDLEPQSTTVAGAVPDPSIFVAFDLKAVAGISAAEWTLILDRLLECLRPVLPPSGTQSALRTAICRRSADATIPYLGFMLARPVPAIRVYLASPAVSSLFVTLGRMGWPGDPDGLAATLRVVEGAPGVVPAIAMVHVEVAGEVLPRVGIEYTFRRHEQARGGLAETAFLQRFVDVRLSTEAKQRALQSWPGSSIQTLSHEVWVSRVSRRVNHVKLLHVPGHALEAKAYLLTHWRPLCCCSVAAHSA